ncbi:MAG TPA: sulfite exporter TauE/SafE family protein [Kineosporiaceae bacterium]|nr:sulfite exporter TauE/SafE family protein [Kineosporiaceae bacterium]
MTVEWWEAVLIGLAGVGAGAINAAVGSGTLITFPTLLAMGFSPLVANVSNNVGLVPGGVAGAWGYRRELGGQWPVLARLIPCSALGGMTGALLLLVLPAKAFETIVPVLIATALLMVIFQPRLAAAVTARQGAGAAASRTASRWPRSRALGLGLVVGTYAAGVYGGYFGAAQGVLLIGALGWLLTDSLQTANGLKNVLSSVVNAIAAVTFVIVAPERVNWVIVLLIAVGSTFGGLLGASLGRRLPAPVLRGVIVVVGLIAVVRLVLT